jgi:hypothetical protein
MFQPQTTIAWGGALLWLLGIAAAAFLASWVLTDRLHLRRTPYVGALAALTAVLTGGYVAWSGAGAALWTTRWAWGLLGAAVVGALLARLVARLPAAHAPAGVGRVAAAWEGVVYGTAEGLLSVLPVVVTWQLFAALGWTSGWHAVVAAAAALAASAGVIVVHHLSYREFRGPAMRSPLVGCMPLSLAYLATASPFAAIGGHIIIHLAMLRRGIELPPHARPGPVGITGAEAIGSADAPVTARPSRA